MQTVDTVPLNILYDEVDGQTCSYKTNGIIINTRDPSKFEKLYADASLRMMQQAETKLEENMNDLLESHSSAIKDEVNQLEKNDA